MERNLVYFRNELKNRTVPKYKLMGIVSEMILSKEIFKKNQDISPFLLTVFTAEFKKYVLLSRTLTVARTIQLISKADDDFYKKIKQELYSYIEQQIINSKRG